MRSAAWWNRCAAQIRSWVVAMTVLPARASASRTSIRSSCVRDVDAGHGLVEQVELRIGGDGAGEEDAPALAARQRPDLAVDGIGHADRLERRGDALAIDAVPARVPKPEPRVAAHHHDLARRSPGTPSRPPRPAAGRRCDLRRASPGGPPRTVRRPADGLMRPAMSLRSVLLPAPFGPMTASSEPGRTSSDDVGQGDPPSVPGRHAVDDDRRAVRGHARARRGLGRADADRLAIGPGAIRPSFTT